MSGKLTLNLGLSGRGGSGRGREGEGERGEERLIMVIDYAVHKLGSLIAATVPHKSGNRCMRSIIQQALSKGDTPYVRAIALTK
jgi:hypothetical protein